ncbi:MAG: mechanosensitive ion channel family protein [Candidatus Abyssobacteria bacterium SURF_17]|jgi:small conductance mechanosensitive channel|uniref:Mechanosensitive ion channel family protein n=1 Tax=Candidatus Abyssobacteria bacterium SURF_17 TaxID=2093361 RepID=A0A419ETD8_9BACT|nr:MAG: mechanosensitive ion channel family protein [Candidatus Abyssubacteria bacterium SURF_17]
MENIIPKLQEWVALYGVRALVAIIILVVGRWIAKMLRNLVERMMRKREVEPTIVSFVGNLVYVALLVFVIIAAINQIGVQTKSFIAVIAAGLAIGLALQGSLANFAAGFLLILFRPFKVGDYIEGAGVAGVVDAVQLFVTQLKTPDNKLVIIPNAKLTGDNIINYSANENRRVDLIFGVSYRADLRKVREVLQDILSKDSRILKDPAPTIAVLELADNSVNFAVRPWVKTADYWDVYFGLTENVKRRFDEEGIGIPFPQRDVHLFQTT